MIVTVQKKITIYEWKSVWTKQRERERKNIYENEILNDGAIIIIARQHDLDERSSKEEN